MDINKAKQNLNNLKATLSRYQKIYLEDGHLDSKEQKKLNEIQAAITESEGIIQRLQRGEQVTQSTAGEEQGSGGWNPLEAAGNLVNHVKKGTQENLERAAQAKRALEQKAAETQRAVERKAAEARRAVERKAAEARRAVERKAAEAQRALQQKAEEARRFKQEAERKAAEFRRAAERKAAEAQRALQQKAEEARRFKQEAERRAVEFQRAAQQKASEEARRLREAAERKTAELQRAAQEKVNNFQQGISNAGNDIKYGIEGTLEELSHVTPNEIIDAGKTNIGTGINKLGEVKQNFQQGLENTGQHLQQTGQNLQQNFNKFGENVNQNIIQPGQQKLNEFGENVNQNIIQPSQQKLNEFGENVNQNIIQPGQQKLNEFGENVNQNIIQPGQQKLNEFGENVNQNIVQPGQQKLNEFGENVNQNVLQPGKQKLNEWGEVINENVVQPGQEQLKVLGEEVQQFTQTTHEYVDQNVVQPGQEKLNEFGENLNENVVQPGKETMDEWGSDIKNFFNESSDSFEQQWTKIQNGTAELGEHIKNTAGEQGERIKLKVQEGIEQGKEHIRAEHGEELDAVKGAIDTAKYGVQQYGEDLQHIGGKLKEGAEYVEEGVKFNAQVGVDTAKELSSQLGDDANRFVDTVKYGSKQYGEDLNHIGDTPLGELAIEVKDFATSVSNDPYAKFIAPAVSNMLKTTEILSDLNPIRRSAMKNKVVIGVGIGMAAGFKVISAAAGGGLVFDPDGNVGVYGSIGSTDDLKALLTQGIPAINPLNVANVLQQKDKLGSVLDAADQKAEDLFKPLEPSKGPGNPGKFNDLLGRLNATVDFTIITTGKMSDFKGTAWAVGGGYGPAGFSILIATDGTPIGYVGQAGLNTGLNAAATRATTYANHEAVTNAADFVKELTGNK